MPKERPKKKVDKQVSVPIIFRTNFLLEKTGKTWDSLTVDAAFDDLDFETFEYFKGLAIDRLPEIKKASYKTIFKNLELITNDGKLTRHLFYFLGRSLKHFLLLLRVELEGLRPQQKF